LWDRATRDALITATAPKREGNRAPKGVQLLSGVAYCGGCGARLYLAGRSGAAFTYGCTARVRGIVSSQHCKPAPSMSVPKLDAIVTAWFLAKYGEGEEERRVYDPGTGHASAIAELETNRKRLREDRQAGLFDSADDTAWFRTEYARMGSEIEELRGLPERAPGMRLMPTGRTIGQTWQAAQDDAARREILNGYDVRVVLHPRGTAERCSITGVSLSEAVA
jgi:hypothetical protein